MACRFRSASCADGTLTAAAAWGPPHLCTYIALHILSVRKVPLCRDGIRNSGFSSHFWTRIVGLGDVAACCVASRGRWLYLYMYDVLRRTALTVSIAASQRGRRVRRTSHVLRTLVDVYVHRRTRRTGALRLTHARDGLFDCVADNKGRRGREGVWKHVAFGRRGGDKAKRDASGGTFARRRRLYIRRMRRICNNTRPPVHVMLAVGQCVAQLCQPPFGMLLRAAVATSGVSCCRCTCQK